MSENDKERNNASREERLVNYANRTNDMREIKNQQWSIVYYCLLLSAGIVGLSSELGKITALHKDLYGALLFIFSILIPVFGIYAIYRNQKILRNNRIETLVIEHNFYTGAEYHIKPITPFYVTYWFHWYYWLVFKVSIIIGAVFTILFLVKRFCIGRGFKYLAEALFSNVVIIVLVLIVLVFLIVLLISFSKKNAIKKYGHLLIFK